MTETTKQTAEEFSFALPEHPRRVIFVADDELPAAQDFAYVVEPSGERYLFIKSARLTPAVLEQAWAVAETGSESEQDQRALREHEILELGIRVGRKVEADR